MKAGELMRILSTVGEDTEIMVVEPHDRIAPDRRYPVDMATAPGDVILLHRAEYTHEFADSVDKSVAVRERLRIAKLKGGDFAVDELRFAATLWCPCGAGMAYPVGAMDMQGTWDCSAILMGTAAIEVEHSPALPFMFYEVKSEDQPSADGQTTRPAVVA